VNNREIWFSQRQPSHQQNPNGTAILQSTATIATQATHCRNESNFTGGIVSSTMRGVNMTFRAGNQKNPNSGSFGLQIPPFHGRIEREDWATSPFSPGEGTVLKRGKR